MKPEKQRIQDTTLETLTKDAKKAYAKNTGNRIQRLFQHPYFFRKMKFAS